MSGKMSPERARELRDETSKGHLRHHPVPFAPQPDTIKQHELRFAGSDATQLQRAGALLEGVDGLEVAIVAERNSLCVRYDLREFSLQGLERALIQQGFVLDNGIVHRLWRAVQYFSEETQLRNMRMPERLIKKSHEIYSRAWEHHPHGDHDDTPTELRRDR